MCVCVSVLVCVRLWLCCLQICLELTPGKHSESCLPMVPKGICEVCVCAYTEHMHGSEITAWYYLTIYIHMCVCVCVSLWEITSGKNGFTQFRYSLHAKRSFHSVCCDIWLRPDLHKHVLVYIETSLMQTRSRVQRRSGSLNERLVWASIQISCPLPARLTRRKLSIFRSVLEAVSSASMQRWQVAFYM